MTDKDKKSGYARDGLDFYVEPFWCVDVLLKNKSFMGPVYDPAVGSGTIVGRLNDLEIDAFGTDIVDRGYGFEGGVDFTRLESLPYDANEIITNPPYSRASEFFWKATRLRVDKVAMLVRLDFLASQARKELVNSLSNIIVLSKRPSMPPGDSDVPARGGQHDFCWIVWNLGCESFGPVLTADTPD